MDIEHPSEKIYRVKRYLNNVIEAIWYNCSDIGLNSKLGMTMDWLSNLSEYDNKVVIAPVKLMRFNVYLSYTDIVVLYDGTLYFQYHVKDNGRLEIELERMWEK